MKIFVSSDIHFGHNNIIRYCSRPFENSNEMDNALIERWNARVSNDDTVYFLGDFAFASQRRIIEVLGLLNFKHLFIVPGNHDEKILDMWHHPVEPVWESSGVKNVTVLDDIAELKHDGKKFVLCHYPMAEWNGAFKGVIHLHGHVHTQHANGAGKVNVPKVKNRYDVGVDMYGGPVELTGDLRYLNNPKGWK